MVTGFYRLFYARSMGFDYLFLFLIPITLIFDVSTPSILAVFIAIIGAYVISLRKRSHIYGDKTIGYVSLTVALYFTTHMFLILSFSEHKPEICIPYPTWLVLIVPISVGMTLIRNPMHAFVLGARLIVTLLVLYAGFFLLTQQAGRLSLGTNPLIAAYTMMLFCCVARFPARADEPAHIGVIFFYIGALPFVATGSRIVLVFYIAALAVDIAIYFFKAIKKQNIKLSAILISLIGVICGIVILSQFGSRLRLGTFYTFFANGIITDQSLLARFDLWRVGMDIFASNPLFGVGRCALPDLIPNAMEALRGRPYQFKHLHNVFIDELAAHGLVGLILMLTLHMIVFKRLITLLNQPGQRIATCILFGAILIYGLTGTHLSDDRMIVPTVLVFGTLLSAGKRQAIKQSRRQA